MGKKRKSNEMEQLEEAGQSIILVDPVLFLSELSCDSELHRLMAEGVLALAGWEIGDVFLAAMDRAQGEHHG
jgi:hypothetical protein